MQPPRLRLTVEDGERHDDYTWRAQAGEVCVRVDVLGDQGTTREIGALLLPVDLVPQLGVLGVLVGLGAIASLEIVGSNAPAVLTIDAKMIRLLKIAGKVLT